VEALEMSVFSRTALTLLLAATVALVGCGSHRLVLETGGAPLDTAGVEQLAKTADIGPADGIDVAQAPDARTRVLSELRTRGAIGDRTASLLTAGFPERTAAIPVLVRACPVNGREAIVVVEAYGSTAGPLTHRRLWVFDAKNGTIVLASSYR
jgi:hypothetical protein